MNNPKTDFYTKSILTIIALCLLVLTFEQLDLFPKAYAGETAKPNVVMGGNYGLVPLNEDGSITVKLISSEELDVNITGISTYDELEVDISEISTNDKFHVNIKEVGGYSTFGALPVKIDN